jgi:hypothetical protein
MGTITNFPDGVNITGGLTADTLSVSGNVTFPGALVVGSGATITGGLDVSGGTTLNSTLTVAGQSTFDGAVRLVSSILYCQMVNIPMGGDYVIVTAADNASKLAIPNATGGGVNLTTRTTGSFASTGNVGNIQTIQVLQGSAISLTSGGSGFQSLGSISLQPGNYLLSAIIQLQCAGVGGAVFSNTSGFDTNTSGTNFVFGSNAVVTSYNSAPDLINVSVIIPKVPISVTTTTTYYFLTAGNFSGTVSAYGTMTIETTF